MKKNSFCFIVLMKKFFALLILYSLFIPVQGQQVFGYYKSSSSDDFRTRWEKIPESDTMLSLSIQERKSYTQYVILYHDVKAKFKIANDVVWRLDSISVHLEKLPSPHYVTFWFFPAPKSIWGIGYPIPPAKHVGESLSIHIFPKSDTAINFPVKAHHNALKIRKNPKRVYVYDEAKGKYRKVSREEALQMVEEENHPQQP